MHESITQQRVQAKSSDLKKYAIRLKLKPSLSREQFNKYLCFIEESSIAIFKLK